MTKIFNKDSIIPIEGGYVVVDNTKTVNKGQRYWVMSENGKGYIIDTNTTRWGYEIIGSIGIKIEGVPLIEISNEVNFTHLTTQYLEELNKDLPKDAGWNYSPSLRKSYIECVTPVFEAGYKANTKQYSEEEVISLVQKLYKPIIEGYYDDMGERQVEKLKKDIVKSLQKVPISVELEYEDNFVSNPNFGKEDGMLINRPKLKVNPNNTITPKSINYG